MGKASLSHKANSSTFYLLLYPFFRRIPTPKVKPRPYPFPYFSFIFSFNLAPFAFAFAFCVSAGSSAASCSLDQVLPVVDRSRGARLVQQLHIHHAVKEPVLLRQHRALPGVLFPDKEGFHHGLLGHALHQRGPEGGDQVPELGGLHLRKYVHVRQVRVAGENRGISSAAAT